MPLQHEFPICIGPTIACANQQDTTRPVLLLAHHMRSHSYRLKLSLAWKGLAAVAMTCTLVKACSSPWPHARLVMRLSGQYDGSSG